MKIRNKSFFQFIIFFYSTRLWFLRGLNFGESNEATFSDRTNHVPERIAAGNKRAIDFYASLGFIFMIIYDLREK